MLTVQQKASHKKDRATMRPTFLLNSDLHLVSALVTKGVEDGLKLYTCIILAKEYETPYGKIPAGSKGFVEYIDPESGLVELLMEGAWPALFNWGNILMLVPFQTDDLAAIIRVAPLPPKTSHQERIEQLHTKEKPMTH